MTPKEALLAAADLIEQPGKWTRFVFARDKNGEATDWHAPEATCFCAMGAIRRVAIGKFESFYAFENDEVWDKAEKLLRERLVSIAEFNDYRAASAAEVAAVMRSVAA